MIKRNPWDKMLDDIKEKEAELKSLEELWRDTRYHKQCNLQNQQYELRIQSLRTIEKEMSRVAELIRQARDDHERKALLEWLVTADPSTNYNSARQRHKATTGDWLVEKSIDFKTWKDTSNSLLWLHGKGKLAESQISITKVLITACLSWSRKIISEVWPRFCKCPYAAIAVEFGVFRSFLS